MTDVPPESESTQRGPRADETPDHLERRLHRRGLLLMSLLILAVLLLGLSVLASNLCVGAVSAILVPLVGIAMFIVASWPPGFSVWDPKLVHFVRSGRAFAQCVGVLLVMLGCAVTLRQLAIARRVSKSAISLMNVRLLLGAAEVYWKDHAVYPSRLADLLDERLITPRSVLCPFDFGANEARVERDGYSSYVYNPAGDTHLRDSAIILVHERLPWSYGQATWWCPSGYEVGFADGTARWLSVDDMSEALARDAARRAALGCPVAVPLGRLPRPPSTSPTSAPVR